MKTKILSCLLAAVLCALLAGCGTKGKEPAPAPAPDPVQPVQDAVQPETPATTPEPEPAPDPAPAPTPEPDPAPQDTQPAEPVLPASDAEEGSGGIAESYVGAWRDDARGTSGGRCFMEISCEDGVNYSIDIWWGSSAAETTHWQYTGTYDEIWEGIDYIGTRYRETTQADGTVEKVAELEEATGLLYLEDGALLWEDTFEHTGEGMKFQKEG